ncbi:MAG: polysaccharide biosynthesis C-terminal domain-containing protein [Oscillospiraceae bacterium]|jgi:O-antigen/teichoic acid export membrane protein|nr:polysaccharide biosynthesis C-terminal domain-containing protein [Oscillospiraceae bacterium]
MGKFRSLISNTLIFAVATLSSKLLTFLLLPLLTYILPPEQLSSATNAMYTCNLILPVMYLCISEAIIRFGLDPVVNRRDLFTCGVLTVLGGFIVVQLVFPLIGGTTFAQGFIEGYEGLVRVYVLTSAMRTVVTHFVRASGLVRIFALDGLLTTIFTLVFVYLFLLKFEMGGRGYVLATICADALSSITLIVFLRLYRFIKLRGLDLSLWKTMLRYSIPLVPTAVFWWVTNLSDRYFVTLMCGKAINGLYDASARFPTIITMVSAIFTQAWQISAFNEYQSKEGEKFYSTVFRSYYTFVFLAASGIIMLIRPVTKLMMESRYYDSWQYAPFLVLAVSFSCFVTFLGTIYNAAKKNAMVTITTAIGAVLNIVLNWRLIPHYGAQGAAFATFVSYFLVFAIRAFDTRKYIKIQMQPARIVMSLALLLAQVWVSLTQPPYGMIWQVLIFVLLLLCNLGYVIFVARHFLGMFTRRFKKA